MKIKNREKLLLLAAASVIVLLLGDHLVFTPLFGRDGFWNRRTAKIEELTKKYNSGVQLLQREKAVRSRWESIRTNALPANASDAESRVLKSVDRWTQASRMNLTSIKPQWKQNSRDDDYVTLECRADGVGDMQSVARFLYELEKDPLALKIEELEITARDDNGQQLALGVRFSGLKLNPDQK